MVLRLSRKTSFLLSGAILLAFFFLTFVVSSWTHTQSLTQQGEGTEETTQVEKLEERPSGSVVLTNFHRSQTKNGRKEWDITADVGEYVPNSNLVRITNGVLVLFREDGSTTTMTAPSADIELAGADLKSASCSGGVTIMYDDQMKLTTESITYWKESGRIYAPTRVTIESSSGTTAGDTLEGSAITRTFTLGGNVQSVFTPETKGSPS